MLGKSDEMKLVMIMIMIKSNSSRVLASDALKSLCSNNGGVCIKHGADVMLCPHGGCRPNQPRMVVNASARCADVIMIMKDAPRIKPRAERRSSWLY